jgi:DNA-binding NtrC family response regulator
MQLKTASVLVIDDDMDVLTAVRLLLRPEVQEIVTEKNPENLRSILSKKSFDVILLDMNFNSSINTGNEGLFWLRKIKEEYRSDAAVIMITAYGDIDLAIKSLKEGAFDFVVKPWHIERLLTTIKEALNQKGNKAPVQTTVSGAFFDNELLGQSDAMQDIFYKIKKVFLHLLLQFFPCGHLLHR